MLLLLVVVTMMTFNWIDAELLIKKRITIQLEMNKKVHNTCKWCALNILYIKDNKQHTVMND